MTAIARTMADALPPIERVREEQAKLAEAGVRYVFSCWDRHARAAEDKAGADQRFREPVHGQGAAVRRALDLLRARAGRGGLRPDPGARPRLPGHLPLGSGLRLDVRGSLVGGRGPTTCVPRQTLRRAMGDAAARGFVGYAGIEPEFIVMRWQDGRRSRPSTTIRSPAKACGRGVRPSATTSSTPSIPWASSARSSISSRTSAGTEGMLSAKAPTRSSSSTSATPDLLEMADRLVFLRVLLKEVAKKQGLFVSLHAQPTIGDWRSGAHINYSMQRVDNPGVNLFGITAPVGSARRVTTPSAGCCTTAVRSPPSPARRSTPTTAWCPVWAASRAAP